MTVAIKNENITSFGGIYHIYTRVRDKLSMQNSSNCFDFST